MSVCGERLGRINSRNSFPIRSRFLANDPIMRPEVLLEVSNNREPAHFHSFASLICAERGSLENRLEFESVDEGIIRKLNGIDFQEFIIYDLPLAMCHILHESISAHAGPYSL